MATRKSQTADSDVDTQPEAEAKEAAEKGVETVGKAADTTAAAVEKAADKGTEVAEASAEAGAEAGEEAIEQVSSASDTAIDSVVISQQQAVETVEASSQAMMEGVTRMQREIVDFVSERIRHDMAAQQEFMRCRNLDDIRAVQAKFFQTAMDQYSAEATKLMRMGTEIFQKSVSRDMQ